MKFYVEGTRTKTVTMVIVEHVEGEVDVTKSEVMRVTGCSSVIDGDSTGWYGEVQDALEDGAMHKTPSGCKTTVIETSEVVDYQWERGLSVDW
jgi:hypothetical protein